MKKNNDTNPRILKFVLFAVVVEPLFLIYSIYIINNGRTNNISPATLPPFTMALFILCSIILCSLSFTIANFVFIKKKMISKIDKENNYLGGKELFDKYLTYWLYLSLISFVPSLFGFMISFKSHKFIYVIVGAIMSLSSYGLFLLKDYKTIFQILDKVLKLKKNE
jgi:hypothetical protein